MLQTLLASGALLQGIKAKASATARQAGIMLAFALIALIFLSVGLMALGLAAAIALAPHLGAAGAAATVGGGAIVIALILLWIGTRSANPRVSTPAVSSQSSPIPGILESAQQQPLPWMVGALVLGLLLGRRS